MGPLQVIQAGVIVSIIGLLALLAVQMLWRGGLELSILFNERSKRKGRSNRENKQP